MTSPDAYLHAGGWRHHSLWRSDAIMSEGAHPIAYAALIILESPFGTWKVSRREAIHNEEQAGCCMNSLSIFTLRQSAKFKLVIEAFLFERFTQRSLIVIET